MAANGTLSLTDCEASNGSARECDGARQPLYVLNTGSPNHISDYMFDSDGNLTPLPGSVRSLSHENALPAQVAFSPTAARTS